MSNEKVCKVKFNVMGIGKPAEGAHIMVHLKMAHGVDIERLRDKETGQSPRRSSGTAATDSNGEATILLWPNTRANFECEYWAWVGSGANRSHQRIGDVPDVDEHSVSAHI